MFVVGTAGSWQLQSYLVQREDADLVAAAPTLVASTIQQQAEHARVTSAVPVNVYAVRIVGAQETNDFVPATGPRPDFPDVTKASAIAHGGHPYTVHSQGESTVSWRVVEGIDETTGEPYAVAVSMANVDTVVRRMQVLTIGVSAIALLFATLAALWAVRRAMRPLRAIEDTAAAIAAGDLTRRVPNPDSADEMESLARSLNVMLSQVERSMEIKDRSEESMRSFVADASHELRTPLATVRGYAELYRQGAVSDPDDVAAAFRRIEDEAKRMSAMVDDLLLLSRLETEQRAATIGATAPGTPRRHHDVDLTVIAADAVSDAEARGDGERRRFALHGLGGGLGPVIISADEQRLRQVMTNLVSNAERYAPGTEPIEVGVGAVDGRAVVEVADHGPGIPADMRGRIFERFYRADVARNRASGSTGLGLSIVAAIVAAHDGEVSVRETPGGGATFVVSLPLAAPDSQAQHSSHHVADETDDVE
ncbi:sensor histidine kinase [Dermacoccus nishinomiyaensis]|uniref:sensor histidine kinase n=1 Tax=Dermacoccus nishinomiyaensis TaxID=1274 RepID=UPI001F50F90B|nr:HAMP domain-containing sensor histidine kinase [Dermacoccus nishinomiyaensis]MCI0153671.1 HAMP domain-containing histidine kinase [Dermacoccus nishinomiyaensis]